MDLSSPISHVEREEHLSNDVNLCLGPHPNRQATHSPFIPGMDADDVEREPLLPEELDEFPVYPIIHLIKADIEHFIDTPLSYDALSAPDLTYSLVQPLYDKYSKMRNMATVFCFLLNRVHFLRDQALSSIPLSQSRAALCELIAIKLLRDYAESTMGLATVMTTSWCIFAGAGPEVLAKVDESTGDVDVNERVGNAIELAIIGQAKRFIKSAAFQKVIDCIWSGKIVYQAESDHSFLSDTYKRKSIHFYDPRKAPLLDHYRLKVPAVRSVLEYIEFLVLFILYVIALEGNDPNSVNLAEGSFMLYAFGFTLDKVAAMQEHGMRVYSANLWNAFDVAFITIFISYASFRAYGLNYDESWAKAIGVDILALGACMMFPRLAFVTLSNNLMVLSLRSMFYEFVVLMLLAAFCFCGFLYALWTLGKSSSISYTPGTIFWWMLDLYFGLDASGFDRATTFHPIFGPVLMVVYACLSNTLLVTVLVSILSHTFSTISGDAVAECMFRRAVTTIEGVKADALFSYQPPLNIFAFIVMLPLSYILNRRWFHKVNVFMIRVTSFPILICIAIYERQKMIHETTTMQETVSSMIEAALEKIPKRFRRLTIVETLTGSGHEIEAIFDLEEELAEEAESKRVSQEASRRHTMSDARDFSADEAEPKKDDGVAESSAVAFPSVSDTTSVVELGPDQPTFSATVESSPNRSEHIPLLEHLRLRRKSSRNDRRPSTTLLIPPDPHLLAPGLPATVAPSPLAQIFHPIVFDDDTEEAVSDFGEGSGSQRGFQPSTSNPISYGPASRRISTSRHKRTKTSEAGGNAGALMRRRTQSAYPAGAPLIRAGLFSALESANTPMSTSPENIDGRPNYHMHHLEPQTVMEIENEEAAVDGHGGNPDVTGPPVLKERLDKIEERQLKIERLLETIVSKLG
ncbi:hypothetical protein FRB99_002224 [Tulasnella sp. 403]|nr:hypothetical protein FRB99_002224 [Tulasnella sp. 403]